MTKAARHSLCHRFLNYPDREAQPHAYYYPTENVERIVRTQVNARVPHKEAQDEERPQLPVLKVKEGR